MSEQEQQELLQKYAQENEAWWRQSGSEDARDEDLDEELRRRHWLETARHYDFGANLAEELIVRLSGESLPAGALSFGVSEAIFPALESSLSSAAEKPVELDVVGIASGSTVLHVRARNLRVEVASSQAVMDSTDASESDQAMREFIKAVNAAEEGADIRQWSKIVDGVQKFSAALDKFDLVAEFAWYALDGTTRAARLSDRGRRYLRGLLDTQPAEDTRTVSGRVTELREAGVVKVKTGMAKNALAYEVKVPTSDLLGMHLEIGANVHFVVREERETDKLGRVRSTTYTFLRNAGEENVLEMPQ